MTDNELNESDKDKENALLGEKSQWLPKILHDYPEILSLRERTVEKTTGATYSRAVKSEKTVCPSLVERDTVLGLIFRHLHAIGLHDAAQTIEKETGLQFQEEEESFEYTGLRILASLGALHATNPWKIKESSDIGIEYSIEQHLDDCFPYMAIDDPNLLFNEIINVSRNKNSNNEAVSLRFLFAKLFAPEQEEDTLNLIIALYNISPAVLFVEMCETAYKTFDECNDDFDKEITEKFKSPVVTNVLSALETWLKYFGLNIGKVALERAETFAKSLKDEQPFKERILNLFGNLTKGIYGLTPKIIQHSLILPEFEVLQSPELTLLDLDTEEIACQVCLAFQEAFLRIDLREFFWAISDRCVSQKTPKLAEFFIFGEQFEARIIEMMYTSKDIKSTVEKLVEIIIFLVTYNCFEGVKHITKVLKMKFLTRNDSFSYILSKIKSVDIVENKQNYNAMINIAVDEVYPCVPNVGEEMFNNDIKKCTSKYRENVIDYSNERKISSAIDRLYRLQNSKYTFTKIKPIFNLMTRKAKLDMDTMISNLNNM